MYTVCLDNGKRRENCLSYTIWQKVYRKGRGFVRLGIRATSTIRASGSKCDAKIEVKYPLPGRRENWPRTLTKGNIDDQRQIRKEQYRQRVRADYCQFEADGIAVDEDAPVVLAPGSGAWVQAWVWVSELKPDPTDD